MMPLRRREGFTIIELLVVIGVIAVLVGLLLPALSGAQKRSRKNTELSNLRQIGFGWSMYANNYGEAALPGFLEPDVQTNWQTTWQTPRRVDLNQNDAAPYTWRLMPFIDFSLDLVFSYEDSYELDMSSAAHVELVARTPAFGYNAFYVGGWWKMVSVNGNSVARVAYHDGRPTGNPTRAVNIVATRVTQIKRNSEVVTFCSSTPNRGGGVVAKSSDRAQGFYLAHAPTVAEDVHWTSYGSTTGAGLSQGQAAGSIYEVNVIGRSGIPLGRYTNLAAVLYADGHTDTQTPGGLDDQRKWIDGADTADFTHTVGTEPHDSFNYLAAPAPPIG